MLGGRGRENSEEDRERKQQPTRREYLGWLLPCKNVQRVLVLLLAQWHWRHVEPVLWFVIILATQDILSIADGVSELEVASGVAGKLLGNVEWLS